MTAEISTSVLPMKTCATTVVVSTCRAATDAIATTASRPAQMANDALVRMIFKQDFQQFYPPDFAPSDRRLDLCFRTLVHGRCANYHNQLKQVTRADCCCSMGEAWGRNCEICPPKFSPQYQELCLESGFLVTGEGNTQNY